MKIQRGDILLVEFDPARGTEIQKTRPAIAVTNNIANTYSRILMAVPLTTQNLSVIYPHEVLIKNAKGLLETSKANVAQTRAIDRSRIKDNIGHVSRQNMSEIDHALKLHLNLL